VPGNVVSTGATVKPKPVSGTWSWTKKADLSQTAREEKIVGIREGDRGHQEGFLKTSHLLSAGLEGSDCSASCLLPSQAYEPASTLAWPPETSLLC
jgi:hypothetical protein